MRITVIIATRDRAQLLHSALASVGAQSRPPDEIIVVDDGVGDGVTEICRAFDRVRYLRAGGRGIAATRNIGVAEATGDIIVVQDDDDVMMPGRIADHVAAFANGVDATCGSWMNVTQRGEDAVLRLVPGHQTPSLSGLLLGSACMAHGAAAYRTSVLRAHPYDETLTVGSDMDLHARLLARGKRFQHTNTVVLVRRLHAGSVTQRFGDVQKTVKEALKARDLAPGLAAAAGSPAALPAFKRADLARALDGMHLDGTRCVLGGLAKTLSAALIPSATGPLVALGHGGFVDVLVPVADAHLGAIAEVCGVVPHERTTPLDDLAPLGAADRVVADPVKSLGLADGGGRILIAIDGLDARMRVRLQQHLAAVSPSWRFVAGHPVLAMAFAAPPHLAIASNRYGTADSLTRAFKAVASAASQLGLPLTHLAVGAVQQGALVGLKV